MRPADRGTIDAAGRAESWAAAYWVRRAEALLAGVADEAARDDLRLAFEERAGVCEFDGGLGRFAAERAAFEALAAAVRRRGAGG